MSGPTNSGLCQQADRDKSLPGSNCPDETRKHLRPSVCFNCGEADHYASRCPEEQRASLVCFSCGGEGHFAEDCKLGKVKVCQRCGEEGHYSNQCTTDCPNCDKDHLPGDCPTAQVTCFLCEGNDHYPKECSMNLLIANSLKMQRLVLRSAASSAIANATRPEKFLDDLSEELQDRLPVHTFPDFQLVNENPVDAGGRKRKRKDRRKCQEKTQGDFRKVADVTCFFCNLKGHYAIDCPKELAATPRPSQAVPQSRAPASQQCGLHNLADVTCFCCQVKGHYANKCPNRGASTSRFVPRPVIRSHAPAKHPDWRVVYKQVDSISAEKSQEAPDVVLGMLLVNSCPDTVLFNSGASHSIVPLSFATVVLCIFALLFGTPVPSQFQRSLLVYPEPPRKMMSSGLSLIV